MTTSTKRPADDDDDDDDWLPTTIVRDATTEEPTRGTGRPTGSTATALPSNVPKVILPNEPSIEQPENTRMIQIGFLKPLNYKFVAKNSDAAAQMFKYLPRALADAGGFPIKNVVVAKLVPLDTMGMGKYDYITTIAKIYYPLSMIDGLKVQMRAPNSPLYNNRKEIVNSLMANVNINIDIDGNIAEDNGEAGSGNNGGDGGDDDTFGDDDSSNKTAKQRATNAGIALGAISLAGLYGAAMFIVARRYKRKRQSHHRSSSLGSSEASSEMRYNGAGSPALMGGALLGRDVSSYGGLNAGGRDSHNSGQSGPAQSARTANISAPVATENSLGWN